MIGALRYFNPRYWASRYWPKIGATPAADPIVCRLRHETLGIPTYRSETLNVPSYRRETLGIPTYPRETLRC